MNKIQFSSDSKSDKAKTNENITKKLSESSVEIPEKKKKFQVWKKIGLFAGLLGVAFSLNAGVVTAKEQESKKGRTSKEESPETYTSEQDSFNQIWERVKQAAELGSYYAQVEISKAVQKATPVVEKTKQDITEQVGIATSEIVKGAKEMRDVSEDYIEEIDLSNILPIAPVSQDYVSKEETPVPSKTKPLITPAVTRKLNEFEIQFANKEVLITPEKEQEVKTITPTHVPETPMAKVDIMDVADNPRQSNYSTFSQPFEFKGANDAFKELGFTTFDIFYPSTSNLSKHEYVISYNELLPIYSEGVMKHSETVIDEVAKYNLENPDYQFSPNIFLALMAIETNGANVESHMAAKGVMQVTTPVAEMYGYTGKDMFKPRINIRVGIKYFSEGYKTGIEKGLSKMEALKYAAMYYNGGPGNANNFFGFSKEPESEIFKERMKVDSQSSVRAYLLKYVGNDRLKGYEFWTYGPRMTKVETVKYAESFERLLTEQIQAIELRNKGLSDMEIKQQLKTPILLKQLKKYIELRHPEYQDYFSEKKVAYDVLNSFSAVGEGDSEIRSIPVNNFENTTAFDFIRF